MGDIDGFGCFLEYGFSQPAKFALPEVLPLSPATVLLVVASRRVSSLSEYAKTSSRPRRYFKSLLFLIGISPTFELVRVAS